MALSAGTRLGPYEILSPLGAGGMGEVYRARDSRLDRDVAIKVLPESLLEDGDALARFEREAKAVAALSHPNILAIHDFGREGGIAYAVMELLQGETLRDRLDAGAIAQRKALDYALQIAQGLAAAHDRGIVHRDLKPQNVFVTRDGLVKILDFGLASRRPLDAAGREQTAATQHPMAENDRTASPLTQQGMILGTVGYMSPEQVGGAQADHRSDLFSFGVILYEMLYGERAFSKYNEIATMMAILREEPPQLSRAGKGVPPELEEIVDHCLEKSPEDRFQSARDLTFALRAAERESRAVPSGRTDGETRSGAAAAAAEAQASIAVLPFHNISADREHEYFTRLMILPFRVLRSDPDTDFLAFSIPDAVGNALAGLQSLVVRSAAAGARYAGDVLDLNRIAREAEVDVVLTGSLVRAGNRMRVTTQLIESPSGTLLWSHAPQVSLQDLFQLQDEVVQGIVDSLSLSLTERERRLLKHDVPASAKAYEFYLRANQACQAAIALDPGSWAVARDLYLQCLEEDPHYAPAWARIGRIYRVMGKWGRAGSETNLAKAEAAFKRALEINPDLSVAHNLYAQLEVDLGRAEDAMLRLIERGKARGADPELFAGLVYACRFCGLLEASVAAHRQARRLDPGVATSVGQTYFMLGDYAQVLAEDINATPNVRNLALAMLGREAEAVANYRALEAKLQTRYGDLLQCGRALLEGRREESLAAAEAVLASELKDPETLFHLGRILARLGERKQATSLVGRAVEYGFFCYPALARDPWLDSLRGEAGFVAVLREAETRHHGAQLTFVHAGGDRVLGLTL